MSHTAVRLRAGVGEPPGAHEQVPLPQRPRRGAEPLPAARQRHPARRHRPGGLVVLVRGGAPVPLLQGA